MEIKKGQIWSHYKGPKKRYEIIAIAKDSETLKEIIVYKALYQSEFKFGQIWTRSLKEFLSNVEINGQLKQRFMLEEE